MAISLALLGLGALLVSTASALITLLLAVALAIRGSPISALALAAGILDVLGLGWIAYLLAGVASKEQGGRKRRRLPTINLIPSMLLSTIASSLTFATLIWIHIQPTETTNTIFGKSLYVLNKVDYGFWGASVIVQSLFVALCFHEPRREGMAEAIRHDLPHQDLINAVPPPQVQCRETMPPPPPPPPLQMQTMVPPIPPYARSITSSQSNDTLASDAKSYRSSFHGAVRPMTSRTRLIRPSSSTAALSYAGHREESDLEEASRSSSMDHGMLGLPSRPTTPVKTRLETIPGSRANSPARPLDGPFPDESPIENPEYNAELRASSEVSSEVSSFVSLENETVIETVIDESRIPPRFRTEQSSSIPSSPTNDESHIHPLFRTDNALPAPGATPGTTVVASAFGGQAMTPKTLNRATSRSRAGSPDGERRPIPGRARSHSRPSAKFERTLSPPPVMLRSRSVETVQTRLALQEVSGNTPALPVSKGSMPAKMDFDTPRSEIAIYVDAES